ncbi:MAG: hypothetical protein ACREJ3_17860 [Polyangiaceae bacterium]
MVGLPSLSFRETMSGRYWLLDAPVDERALTLTFEARTSHWSTFLRDKTWLLQGTIDAEGLASRSELAGTLTFGRLEERRLPYRFEFRGDDGKRYELTGHTEWSGLSPVESLTLLPATLSDDRGEEVARAMLRFDLRADWGSWLKSFRLRWMR